MNTHPHLIHGVVCAAAIVFSSNVGAATLAEAFPQKPVRFIVPFVPGAGTDITTRALSAKLSQMWGQQVVADNRSGAGGAIAAEITARADPDGYTICLISAGHSVLSASGNPIPYDLEKDLQAIAQVTSLFYVLTVHPSLPAKSVAELIAYARANPGKLNQGSSGTGALQHLSGEMMAYKAGVKFTHIPYKGGAAALAATLGGEVDMSFTTLLSARPHMQSNRLRILGITAGKRSPAAPELPTIAEGGVPGFEANQWYGVITSAKVPKDIVNKLSLALNAAVNAPDVAERLMKDGSTPNGTTPAQFQAHIKSEIAKWRELIKVAGIKLN
ncbi:MAG: tripartite tricarboxylate transporter substrate binding protein [Betaproteobacteria bacterium]